MATDTALLVIDLQVGNVGAAYQREAIVARRAEMVAEARAAGTRNVQNRDPLSVATFSQRDGRGCLAWRS